jgi:hypothetical protein
LIAREAADLKLMERWAAADEKFASGAGIDAFRQDVEKLSADIRRTALKEIKDL